jgi:hypothetical protein
VLSFSSFISTGISTLYAFVLVTLSFFRGYLKIKRILLKLLKIKDNWNENFLLLKDLKNI